MFVQYLVGPEFDRYPATLLLHLGLLIAGWMSAMYAWHLASLQCESAGRLAGRHALAAVLLAGFVFLRYVPGLFASLTQDALPEQVSGDVTMFWLIVVADLAVFVPLALATAFGVRRRRPWARLALTAMVGWFTLVSIAVGAMSLTMLFNDDPDASSAQFGLFVVTSIAVLFYTVHLHKDLSDNARSTAAGPRSP